MGSRREGIRCPPTTHFISTVDDLTDVLDFDSEGIDGMDDDAGEDSESLGRWTPTSSHDIYMVDTPKEDDGSNPEDKTPGKSKNGGADAAQSPATVKIATRAPERSTTSQLRRQQRPHGPSDGAGQARSRRTEFRADARS